MNTLDSLSSFAPELSSDQAAATDGGIWPLVIFGLYVAVGYGVGQALD